jgi:hypothetical protein
VSAIRRRNPNDFEQFLLPPDYNKGLTEPEEDKYKQYIEAKPMNITADQEFDLCKW